MQQLLQGGDLALVGAESTSTMPSVLRLRTIPIQRRRSKSARAEEVTTSEKPHRAAAFSAPLMSTWAHGEPSPSMSRSTTPTRGAVGGRGAS
ncbi:hypothetical protein ACFQ0B_40320 [Nonomuraea thailandensis]